MTWRSKWLLVFLAACATPKDGLVRFDPAVGAGLQPEILAEKDRGDYSLVYVLSSDGSRIRTRFLGPSEALSAGFGTQETIEGSEHVLVGTVGSGELRVTLARWKLDGNGRAIDVRVRTEPVAEIRTWRDRERGELVAPCEWRPWVDGRGVGAWRR